MGSQYTVVIKSTMDTRGLKAGEREAKSTFDNITAAARKASQEQEQIAKQQQRAVEQLQRQRSAALISAWKSETAAYEREQRAQSQSAISLQRQRSAALIAQQRQETQSAVSLQRQRSAALIAQARQEERERASAARSAARAEEQAVRQSQRAIESLQRQRSAALIRAWKEEQRAEERSIRERQRAFETAEQQKTRAAEQSAQRQAAASQRATQLIVSGYNAAKAAVLAVFAAITAGALVLGGAIQRAMRMENLKLSLEVVAGSAEEAQKQLKRLTELARLPGLGFAQAIDASIKLQIGFQNAVKDTKTRVDLAEESIRQFSNAIALTGGGPDVFERVITQVTQMAAAGKVLMQDLRPIITQAPALGAALQRAFGTTSPEQINALGLSTEQFMRRWLAALAELKRAPDTASNAVVNFLNTLDIAIAKVGAPFLGPLRDALNKLEPLAEQLGQRLSQLFTRLGEDARQLWADLPESTRAAFGDMLNTVQGLGQQILDWIRQNYPLMKEAIANVLNQIAAFWNAHGEEIKAGWRQTLDAILSIAKAGLEALKGDWNAAGKSLGDALLKGREVLKNSMSFLVGVAIDAVREQWPKVRAAGIELGKGLADGVWEGIKNSDTATKVKLWAIDVAMAARQAWAIRSPSQVFYAMGQQIAAGLHLGIQSGAPQIQQTLADLLDITANKFTKAPKKPAEHAAKQIADMLRKQADALRDIGGRETEVQRVNRLLSDPSVAKRIDERTKALIRQAAALQDTLGLTRPRIVGSAAQDQFEADAELIRQSGITRPRTQGTRTRPRLFGALPDETDLRIAEVYAGVLDDLNGKLQGHVQLSQVEITLQRLQSAGLTDLTDARAQEALAIAAAIDQQDALNESRQRINKWASDISDIFARAAYDWDGTFKGFFRSLGQGFMDMARRIFAEATQSFVFGGVQSLLGAIFGGRNQQQQGGGIGGFFNNLFGGIFRSGGASPVGATAGGGAGTQLGSGLAAALGFPGSISVPASSSQSGLSIQQIAAIAQGNPAGGAAGGGGLGGGFSLSGLAAAAPLLGAGIGAGIGAGFGRGASPVASIMGALGLGAVGLVGGSALPSLLAGTFAGFTALGAATLGIGAVLAIGAFIIGRNAQRRKEEQLRDAWATETRNAAYQLLAQAGQMTLPQVQSAWTAIKSDYMSKVATLKDSKTRRHAELWFTQDLEPALWPQIEAAVKTGEQARKFESSFVPTFGKGGVFRSDFFLPRAARGLMQIPGVFDRKDDLLMRVSRGERVAVMTPDQFDRIGGRATFERAGVPALAGGGSSAPSTSSGTGDIVIQTNDANAAALLRFLLEGMKSSDGRKIVVSHIRGDFQSERSDGLLGDISQALFRR